MIFASDSLVGRLKRRAFKISMFSMSGPSRSRWLRFHLWHWSLFVSDSGTSYTKVAGGSTKTASGAGRQWGGQVERTGWCCGRKSSSGGPRTAYSHCSANNTGKQTVNFKDMRHFIHNLFYWEWIIYWTAGKTMLAVFLMKLMGHIPAEKLESTVGALSLLPCQGRHPTAICEQATWFWSEFLFLPNYY